MTFLTESEIEAYLLFVINHSGSHGSWKNPGNTRKMSSTRSNNRHDSLETECIEIT
jgi:hypothetical protein